MEKDAFLRHIQCFDLALDLRNGFYEARTRLKEDHDRFMQGVMAWHRSDRTQPFPDRESWKSPEGYGRIIAEPENLPLIRLEYLTALRTSIGADKVPTMCWEEAIRDMTGGNLKFPEEIPAMSSDKTKAQICGLNFGAKKDPNRTYGDVRTGLDYICGHILRIDRMLGENTLPDLVKYKIINPS